MKATLLIASMLWFVGYGSSSALEPRPIPVILSTDIGGDVDDVWALSLMLASPQKQKQRNTPHVRDLDRTSSTLWDTVAVYLTFDESLCHMRDIKLRVTDNASPPEHQGPQSSLTGNAVKHFLREFRSAMTVAWLVTAKRLHSKAQGRSAAAHPG